MPLVGAQARYSRQTVSGCISCVAIMQLYCQRWPNASTRAWAMPHQLLYTLLLGNQNVESANTPYFHPFVVLTMGGTSLPSHTTPKA